MKLFAQIADLTGIDDGIQGMVVGFATLAESDGELATLRDAGVSTARTESRLAALVGEDLWKWFVAVPRYPEGHEHAGQFLHCAGWTYQGGVFVEPDD
jgi:hypothetical protein